eukprot:6970432-Prymnesium_polylepis.1
MQAVIPGTASTQVKSPPTKVAPSKQLLQDTSDAYALLQARPVPPFERRARRHSPSSRRVSSWTRSMPSLRPRQRTNNSRRGVQGEMGV